MLLEAIGEDPDREELVETWERRLPAALETLTEGQRTSDKPDVRTFEAETEDLVVKTGIPIYSLCEHHMLPYYGTAHVGYRPNGEIAGLSKLSRYVRWQSRRLTVQERLARELVEGLAEGVVLEITATHLCEAMRGIETATETTQATAGDITNEERQQFRSVIDNHV
jgi:GTP cyclohydrolase I